MARMSISTDRDECRSSVKWWRAHRFGGGEANAYIDFIRHQIKLVAELQELPQDNDFEWLVAKVKKEFPGAGIKVDPADRPTEDHWLDITHKKIHLILSVKLANSFTRYSSKFCFYPLDTGYGQKPDFIIDSRIEAFEKIANLLA
jgi:hypothetical protein